MRDIEVRRLKFRFDPDVQFQWNPGNPGCGNFFNILSFVGPAFERYFIRAVGEAMPRIRDPRIQREAKLFCQQEGQHATNHAAHLKLLADRYPGLARVQQDITASYDQLLERETVEFNLAYMASLELLFTPLALFIVQNVEKLFGESDPRIASFMLWHMVEEFEHRRCASEIYEDVVGSHGFRLRNLPATWRHMHHVATIAREGMKKNVPETDNLLPHDQLGEMFRGTQGRLALARNLITAILAGRDHEGAEELEWITQWFAASASGDTDMTLYYPTAR